MAISAIALRRARYSWSRKPGWSGSSCTREISTWSRNRVGSIAVITIVHLEEIKKRPPILLGLMAGFRKPVFGATWSMHADSPSPDRPSHWRAGRNSNNSDKGSGSCARWRIKRVGRNRQGLVHAKAQRSQRRKGGSNAWGAFESLTRLCVFAIFAPLREINF